MVGEPASQQHSVTGSDGAATETVDRQTVQQKAGDALARRIPPVRPDELRNPRGPAEEASVRAANNARWWSGLNEAERNDLIAAYPQHIGNAEGIDAADRDRANRAVLHQMKDQADAAQSKVDRGERLTRAERKLLHRMDKLDLAIRKADGDAVQAGLKPPMLLALDVSEFGDAGRAVLSYGADPYTAESVSWHVPGVASSVDTLLGFNTTSALHHLQAVQQENPGLSAAAITWIGYDAPSGWNILRAAGHGMARTGGDILYSDIRAFNAARDTLAGNGSHFTGNHIFGYSYGSTTTGYAGHNGRFAGHVRTVSLVGSPGAGPVRTAGEFGIGAENVFAASSSRDVVTALGGRTADSNGRILGIGLGTDPAMDSFGAVRVTAEPQASMNRLLTGGTHHTYFLNTEATTNLGRIAAGRTDAVTTEQHRFELGRSRHAPVRRTVEPAGDRVGARRLWNVLWRRPPNCAVTVTEELSSLFEGRKFELDTRPSRRGVPARALFRAVGADARFATYDEVEATLLGDPTLRVAVLTSQWAGGRQGGHAYLAVKVDGEVRLYDPHTRKYSPWPPHWGRHAVTQTAVGYLQTNGDPVGPMTVDIPLQLDAADAVGNVQGPQSDPDFARRQAEYRAQDPADRLVDTRYAEPLGDVVDNATDRTRVRQLAHDLSGRYGPYRIHFRAENLPGDVMLTGDIFHGDNKIGTIQRSFDRDGAGNLVAYHTGLVIDEKLPDGTLLRGKGFSKAVTYELERLYVRSGVDHIQITTHDKGSFAFARRGYAWDPRPAQLQQSLDRVKQSAGKLSETVSDEAKGLLEQVVAQLDPSNPRLPEPIDLANLATREEPDLGQRLLDGAAGKHSNGVHYVKYLDPASIAQPPTGLKGWLKNLFGRENASSAARDNCAHGVAGELSRLYPRRFDLSIAPSSTGVPAWALFEAAQARSEFATHDDIEAELLGRPAGSSAIVVSRWAFAGPQREAHAYLAVTDGRQVQLYDPRTRQYSPWPPSWVEEVDRTAVGYLDENGEPLRPLHDVPLQLGMQAADSVGDVKGHPARDLGLPDHASGTLSEGQAIAAFSEGEARMRDLNEQLAEAGVSAEERARRLSAMRNSLRSWAYDLMSNRDAAEFLARATVNPTFEDLVARNAERGLTGDAIFEAIIDSSTHSRLAPGSLTDIETGAVYSQFELGLRALNVQMVNDGHSAEDRARTLSGLRSSLRAWTRELMENRPAADWMAANESNPSFDDLVARYERKGLTGDDVYNANIDSATHSHYSAGTLTNEETRTVYTNYELRMRELRDQLLRDGVSVEERARTMYGMRATIRLWTRSLMADRAAAEWLNENERNPTFEELVERNRAKGRVGDEIYEAIIASSTRSRGSVNADLGIDPENPPDLPPMRGPDDGGPQDQDQEGDTT
ncbi:alpha/beta hydrolase [Mycolicibacterium fortuitum]|uniref:alpha/beta hydrolase n=1 Tax=Mycolicibacterium fortuitum TaxID=1766 RepID=UPI002E353544|nr:alpha/beta hydrolase [Mycolicibacterium fortuitum]